MLLGLTQRYTAIPVPGGKVYVGDESPLIDVTTILDIWEEDMFPADCAGRVVIDIGAHKGYFGAWALAQGAQAVISCEPQSENFGALRLSRLTNVRRLAWQVNQVAVGSAPGRARLFLSNESWAHSLYPHMTGAQASEASEASEDVEVTDMRSLLALAKTLRPGSEVVVKLNVEGAAGDVLFAVQPSELTSVVEFHLDHEPGSPHSIEAILDHLAAAGLTEVHVHRKQLFIIKRTTGTAMA
jgi:FkbM family methyltransferase